MKNCASGLFCCLFRNNDGKEALALIYLHLPEAMWDVYDSAVKLQDDHQSFNIDWAPVIGYRHGVRSPKKQNHGPDGYTKVPPLWVESESLKYVLVSESWGCPLLRHPLVKLFLELKWRKIQWLFWISFLLQVLCSRYCNMSLTWGSGVKVRQ